MFKISYEKFLLALARSEMTTSQLNERSGVCRSTISKIMNGETTVRPSTVGKLAKALNVTVEQIVYIDNN